MVGSIHRRAAMVAASLACVWLGACGGDSKGESVQLDVKAVATTASALELPSGARLDVPAGALGSDMTIVLSTLPTSQRRPPNSAAVATTLWLEPEGATFQKALTISIPISPSDLPAGRSIDEVVIATAPHGSDAFVPLPTRRSGSAVVADTTHFSDFVAIVWDADAGMADGGSIDAGTPDSSVTDGAIDAGPAPDASDDAGLDASAIDDAAMDAGTSVDAGPADAAVDAALPAPNGLLHVFETAVVYDGNLGGPAGADAKCMADANRPTSGAYKALLVTTSRSVCSTSNCASDGGMPVDWVFLASTQYYEGVAGSEIAFASTDANGLLTTYATSLGGGYNFWFGGGADWLVSSTTNCADFADSSTTVSGTVGWDGVADGGFIAGGSVMCNTNARLVCVEQ